MSLNGGSSRPITTAADVRDIVGEFMQLTARAALAAGYTLELRTIRYERMLYANGKHFHPFSCWEQCVRLIVDTQGYVEISAGYVFVTQKNGIESEKREPTSDAEYRLLMCDAVVRNVAKGFTI